MVKRLFKKGLILTLLCVAVLGFYSCSSNPTAPKKRTLKHNSNSVVINGLEHTIRTGKGVYNQGDTMKVDRFFVNHNDEDVIVFMDVGPPAMDVSLTRLDDKLNPLKVRYGGPFSMFGLPRTFTARDTLMNPLGYAEESWGVLTDSLQPGIYSVYGMVFSGDSLDVKVDVEIK